MNSLRTGFYSKKPVTHAFISALALMACIVFAGSDTSAHARAGYASWLKHGDAYRVSGDFAGYKGSMQVLVKWRGNRFVVATPIGTFPLKRAGSGVTFRVIFEKVGAKVTWINTRATVVWKGRRSTAAVRKIDRRAVAKDRGNTQK